MADLTRVLRPFDGLDAFDDLLELVTVRFGEKELSPGNSVTVDDALDYLARPIDIDIPFGSADGALDERLAAALTDASLEAGDVDFLIVSTTGGVRRTDVLERINLKERPVPTTIPIEEKPPSLRAPTHGADIEVMLLLARELEPEFAKPHRKGTWLGRSRFTLLTTQPAKGFQVLPLTDAVIEDNKLGTGVHWFVKIPNDADMAAEGQDLGDILKIYVAINVLNRLKLVIGTPDGDFVQYQLVLDAIRAVVTRIHQDLTPEEPPEMPPANSPFHQLLTMRTGAAQPSTEELEASLERFAEQPEAFVADIAHRDSLNNVVHRALANPE